MEIPFGFGTIESKKDFRTIQHEELAMATFPLVKGGFTYLPEDIEHQHKVGICTGISGEQNRRKANKKKYNADFQYLLQKKFIDKNWDEGSSIFSFLKVANKYGFLPENLWTHTTEEDRNLPYPQYIAKLQAISDDEINRLISLSVDKIPGYAQVDVTDPQKMAKAINDSEAGILCRYEVGEEWWLPSWNISMVTAPKKIIGGHAIDMIRFDYAMDIFQTLANTWGPSWGQKGCVDVNWKNYRPTEAWTITPISNEMIQQIKQTKPPINKNMSFEKDLKLGMDDPDVKELQKFLNKHGFTVSYIGAGSEGEETTLFGPKTLQAVKRFQSSNNIPNTGYVGIITRTVINKII